MSFNGNSRAQIAPTEIPIAFSTIGIPVDGNAPTELLFNDGRQLLEAFVILLLPPVGEIAYGIELPSLIGPQFTASSALIRRSIGSGRNSLKGETMQQPHFESLGGTRDTKRVYCLFTEDKEKTMRLQVTDGSSRLTFSRATKLLLSK